MKAPTPATGEANENVIVYASPPKASTSRPASGSEIHVPFSLNEYGPEPSREPSGFGDVNTTSGALPTTTGPIVCMLLPAKALKSITHFGCPIAAAQVNS